VSSAFQLRLSWAGCILLPRYLDSNLQLDLLEAALWDYTTPPNPLSLSTHYAVPPNLFELYANHPESLVSPLHEYHDNLRTSLGQLDIPSAPSASSRTRNETEPGSVMGYEEILAKTKIWEGDQPSDKLRTKTVAELMKEIRWANLGWVYRVCPENASYGGQADTSAHSGPQKRMISRLTNQLLFQKAWSNYALMSSARFLGRKSFR
jgi:hypothetical protein